MQPFETVIVDTPTVSCAGAGGPNDGHPKVWLNLSDSGRVECPYCSKLFIRRGSQDRPAKPAAKRR